MSTNNTIRYFLYVRKSTDDKDRQARSISDQLAEIRALAKNENYKIVDRFEESQSAMTRGRPVFNEMLDRIEAGEADGIIAWHPDRLARNAFDGGRIIDLLDTKILLDLRFCSFWFENTAQGKLMLNLAFGQGKYFSDTMSVNIRRAQRQKLSEGVWSWKAPVGYINHPKSRTITVDPQKAPLVKRAFELYATGNYSIERLRDFVHSGGLRSQRECTVSLSVCQKMLTNTFYYGLFNVNGEIYEGSHEPLITKALFDQVQAVMRRRSKPNPLHLKDYVYRGLFRCGECGCTITMETQKGHNYLRCTKRVKKDCSQRYAREDRVTKQIADALLSVSLSDDWADWMCAELEAERERGELSLATTKADVEKGLAAYDLKIDRLASAYLDEGAFAPAEFRKHKQQLINGKRMLLDKLAAINQRDVVRFEPLMRFINGSKQMKFVASRSNPQEMRNKLHATGSNLMICDRNLRWEPRGAWQIVAAKGSIAQHNTATLSRVAVSAGESHLSPEKCR